MPEREDGRTDDELRPVTITRGFTSHPAGSVLIEFGASGAAGDQLCLGHLHDQLLGNEADAVTFGQRDTRLE